MDSKTKSKLLVVCRTLLGAIFLIVGTNEYHHLIARPEFGLEAESFLTGLKSLNYLYNMIIILEVTFGALLIAGFLVPLVNLLVIPILFNILLFHTFLAPETIYVPIVMVACNAYIFYYYRDLAKFVLRYSLKIDPNSSEEIDLLPRFADETTEIREESFSIDANGRVEHEKHIANILIKKKNKKDNKKSEEKYLQ
jgi:uncharacterized membrane protein YphA (DoxX/SURF4 family)